jgi:hypothetical protein
LLQEKKTTDFAEFKTTYIYNKLKEGYKAQDYLSSKTSNKKISDIYQNDGIKRYYNRPATHYK